MSKKPTYCITVTDTVTRTSYYEIEADSEAEAIQRIKDGEEYEVDVEYDESSVFDDDAEYDVYEVIQPSED
jgi:hypothetical protein